MSKPLFDVVTIMKNESKVIKRLAESLKEFLERGGKWYSVDTGSTDGTPEIARSLGCEVTEVGDRFRIVLTDEQVKEINEKFIVEGEEPIVKIGDSLFDYASARNFAATLSEQNMIAMPDCDEVYEKLDIDKLNEGILNGAQQYEYSFCFAHDQFGNETVKFRHSKFYNKTVLSWLGIIHEVLNGNANRVYLGEDIIKLAHWQNHSTDRGGYPKGLALDCLLHPEADRNAFYFARDLMYHGRDNSAIAQFKRHIAMEKWPAERAQSMVFIGDILMRQKQEEESLAWYWAAWNLEPARRIGLMRLARYFDAKGDRMKVACLINAVLQIPESGFYGENMDEYRDEPHHLLAWAYKGLGRTTEAQEQFLKALAYKPLSDQYRRNAAHFGGLQECLNKIGIETKFTGERLIPEECIPDLVLEHKARYEFAKKFVEGHSVLDAACGEGYGCEILNASSYVGWDIDKETIVNARKKYEKKKQKECDCEDFVDFRECGCNSQLQVVDLNSPHKICWNVENIVSFETIEHLDDPSEFLNCVKTACEMFNSTFIFSIPVSMPSEFHKQVYTQEQIKELIGKYFKHVIWYGQTGGEIEELKEDSVYVVGIASNDLPKVSILIPHLENAEDTIRQEGLQKCLDSIEKINYPKELIEVIVNSDKEPTVPQKVKTMYEQCAGDVIIYAANDTEFTPDCVITAVLESKDHGLVALNTGELYPQGGNECEHFLIRRDLVEKLKDGEIFHTSFAHTGCDNYLRAQTQKLGEFIRSKNAVMIHNHFTRGAKMDDVYKRAWNEERVVKDRENLKRLLDELYEV